MSFRLVLTLPVGIHGNGQSRLARNLSVKKFIAVCNLFTLPLLQPSETRPKTRYSSQTAAPLDVRLSSF
jgi:hypothetical protein